MGPPTGFRRRKLAASTGYELAIARSSARVLKSVLRAASASRKMLATATAAHPEIRTGVSRATGGSDGKSAINAAAVTHRNQASRKARNANTLVRINNPNLKGSIFLRQPRAR